MEWDTWILTSQCGADEDGTSCLSCLATGTMAPWTTSTVPPKNTACGGSGSKGDGSELRTASWQPAAAASELLINYIDRLISELSASSSAGPANHPITKELLFPRHRVKVWWEEPHVVSRTRQNQAGQLVETDADGSLVSLDLDIQNRNTSLRP